MFNIKHESNFNSFILLIKRNVNCYCIIVLEGGGTLHESYLAPRGNVSDTAGCSNYFEDQDTLILL